MRFLSSDISPITSRPMHGVPSFPDKHTILFERAVAVPREKIWAALTQKQALGQWFMESEIELKVNGKFSFQGGWDGWVAALRPLEYIQFNSSKEAFSRFEIHPGSGQQGHVVRIIDRMGAEVTMTGPTDIAGLQPGGPGTHWVGVLAGWHDFADALAAYLKGEKPQDRYEALCGFYKDFLERHYSQAK